MPNQIRNNRDMLRASKANAVAEIDRYVPSFPKQHANANLQYIKAVKLPARRNNTTSTLAKLPTPCNKNANCKRFSNPDSSSIISKQASTPRHSEMNVGQEVRQKANGKGKTPPSPNGI